MTDEAAQRAMDAEEHRKSYNTIMKACTEFGVPASLALAMFFTQLVMGNAWWSVLWMFVTYFFSWYVVKTFFTH